MKIKINTIDKVKVFNKIACDYESDVFLYTGRYCIDGKSIMGLFSLDLSKELDVEFIEKSEGEMISFFERLKQTGVALE